MHRCFVRGVLVALPNLLGCLQTGAAAEASSAWIDELRLGNSASIDRGTVSGYAQFEALFSPLPSAPLYNTAFSFLFTPRPLVGATISEQKRTNGLYGGFAWSLPVPSPFLTEFTFGGLVHDQNLFENYPDRERLTTRFLFRESISIGLEINQFWRVSAFADHLSNGNLGYSNRGINKVGVMLGAKLGGDRSAPPPLQSPSPISDFSWAGPYAGLSGGIAVGRFNFVIEEPSASPLEIPASRLSLNLATQLGWNWMIGSLLTGFEVDFGVQRLESNASRFTPIREEISVFSNWLATARARLGVVVDPPLPINRVMVYGTGGVALSRLAPRYCDPAINACFIDGEVGSGWITNPGIRSGWTVGFGTEAPVTPQTTIKIEYLYANFGSFSFDYQSAGGLIHNEVDSMVHVIHVGLNFGFWN